VEILANYLEKRKHPRIKVRRPIIIYTDKGTIEGESRNITSSGMFIHCEEKLCQDEVYRISIALPLHKSIEVKGKLMWSNLEDTKPNSIFSGMGFSFVKISDEDRHLLNDAVSAYFQ